MVGTTLEFVIDKFLIYRYGYLGFGSMVVFQVLGFRHTHIFKGLVKNFCGAVLLCPEMSSWGVMYRYQVVGCDLKARTVYVAETEPFMQCRLGYWRWVQKYKWNPRQCWVWWYCSRLWYRVDSSVYTNESTRRHHPEEHHHHHHHRENFKSHKAEFVFP